MILYFTGTGNSKFVADELARLLDDDKTDLNKRIQSDDNSPISSEKPWVLVVPTYAWQIPHIVIDRLIKTILFGNEKIYFVMTCGDNIGNAWFYAERFCQNKNLEFCGCRKVIMPENYIAMFATPKEDEAKKIIENAKKSILPIAQTIAKGEKFAEPKISLLDRLCSGPINKAFYALFVKAKPFRATDRCVSCGLCEKVCPLNNISIKDGRPEWGEDCTHCMACISRCPEEAIEYGNKSKGKPRYVFRE